MQHAIALLRQDAEIADLRLIDDRLLPTGQVGPVGLHMDTFDRKEFAAVVHDAAGVRLNAPVTHLVQRNLLKADFSDRVL